ncbi:(d)CMP kinase [Methyloligella sp. 2.7D]|uniref:(d)CMP kinase n=1 Tax=unclassified Methyloligella TaxID=2625955 RepID=UPI00157DF1A9|nr:(d)CMP kinase [Methyloligella sp. GL2]QKP76067.1 (d)CMP kinase [Methyloligella sp. GL2]
MIIAIDGPAASGKGTLSKLVAAHYRLAYLDTGALYRAVARDTIANGGDPADAQAAAAAAKKVDPATLDDQALRAQRLGEAASQVARHEAVRQALLSYQREFAQKKPGAVLDGRDIGTVICPEAEVKLFVTASPEERAHRRYLQLAEAGIGVSEAEVLADIRRRDERDKNREAAPLVQAVDAYLLDTTNLAIDAAFKAAIDVIDGTLGRTGAAS